MSARDELAAEKAPLLPTTSKPATTVSPVVKKATLDLVQPARHSPTSDAMKQYTLGHADSGDDADGADDLKERCPTASALRSKGSQKKKGGIQYSQDLPERSRTDAGPALRDGGRRRCTLAELFPARVTARRGTAVAAQPVPLHEREDFQWVIMGACILAFFAGWVDVVAMVTYNQLLTHQSGETAHLARAIATGTTDGTLGLIELGAIVASFVLGAITIGAFLGTGKFVLGRRYGVVMIGNSFVLTGGALLLHFEKMEVVGMALWAFSMGSQNSMMTSFSGAVVRTTHVTGVLTDIGLTIGNWLRAKYQGSTADVWKLQLHGPIWCAFLTGGVAGSFAVDAHNTTLSVLPVAGVMFVLGLAYFIGRETGVFNHFLEENLAQERLEALKEQATAAVCTMIEEDGDAVVELEGAEEAESLMGPVRRPSVWGTKLRRLSRWAEPDKGHDGGTGAK